MNSPTLHLLPAWAVITNGGMRCDADAGPCACGAWHLTSQIERVRQEHAAEAQRNAGQPGLPQGPCSCDICRHKP